MASNAVMSSLLDVLVLAVPDFPSDAGLDRAAEEPSPTDFASHASGVLIDNAVTAVAWDCLVATDGPADAVIGVRYAVSFVALLAVVIP